MTAPCPSGLRIYLNVSCLNRPFDDQEQPRIRLHSTIKHNYSCKCLYHEFLAAPCRT